MLLKDHKNLNIILKLIDSSKFNEVKEELLLIKDQCINDFAFYDLLAQICEKIGDIDSAIENYSISLKLNSKFYQSKFNLAVIYYKKKELDKSEELFQSLINEYKKDYNSYYNLGIIKFEKHNYFDAINFLNKAISINNFFYAAYHQLGVVYEAQGDFISAISNYQKAIELDTKGYALSYNNLGNIYLALKEYDKARLCFKNALKFKGKKSSIYFNLGIVYYELNNVSESIRNFENASNINNKNIKFTSTLISVSHFLDDNTDYRKKFLQRYRNNISLVNKNLINNYSYNNNIIRLGFLSNGFRKYPTGYFLLDFIKKLNEKNCFKLHAFSNSTYNDEYTIKLKSNFTIWNDVQFLNNEQLINLIRDQEINILIDMQGHTYDNRIEIFANKPAPVQISWAAYLSSTGIPEIDYILGDKYVTPIENQCNYVEKIWNLPNIWCVLSTSDINNIFVSPESPVNKNGFITFGCFNNVKKINDLLIKSWSKILVNVPQSKLYIKSDQFIKLEFIKTFKNKFISKGVRENQLIFENSTPREDLLKCYNKVDIALDTFPYSGGTTNFELSFMCVPLITMKGNNFISRCGISINENLEMQDLIANDFNEYEKIAINLAKDLNKINFIKSKLVKNSRNSSLFNIDKFSKDFTQAINDMWTFFLKQNR